MTPAHRAPHTFSLKPTFPLDKAEIQRRILAKKIKHPLSAAVLIASAVVGIAFGNGLLGLLAAGAIGVIGLSAYWKNRSDEIEAGVIRELIAESNEAQDRKLAQVLGIYSRRGFHHYATALGKVVLLKKHIESELHKDGVVTESTEHIDALIDHLCAAVCRQFFALTELDKAVAACLTSGDPGLLDDLGTRRTQILGQIMHAYKTIYDTLDVVLEQEQNNAASSLGGADNEDSSPHIDRIIERLKEENHISRRVQQRLEIAAAEPGDPDYGVFPEKESLDLLLETE